jgi:trk system potassium uptake protein TrkH
MVFVPRVDELYPRESLGIVAGGWLAIGVAGTLPYLLWGPPFDMVNALFESMSGVTTTGSSILVEIETLPMGLLFWRSLTHWLGGVGIILLALAIFPSLKGLSHTLLRSEGSAVGAMPKLPRARNVARIILFIYVGMTLLETIVLMGLGLPILDSITTAFATIATGGFSIRDGSIAAYNNVLVEIVLIVFMVASGMNFALLYGLIFGRGKIRGGQTTALAYLGIFAAATVIVTFDVHGNIYPGWATALRYSAFQVASIGSSTGFATADSSIWPGSTQMLLMLLALVCASAGSTSGGIKVDRMVLFFHTLRARMFMIIHPQGVTSLRIDNHKVSEADAHNAMLFIVTYLAIVGFSSLAVALTGVPLVESVSATIACIGNVGPGLGEVGSMGNYGDLPQLAKLILTPVMLVGRLEIFPLLMLGSRRYWR